MQKFVGQNDVNTHVATVVNAHVGSRSFDIVQSVSNAHINNLQLYKMANLIVFFGIIIIIVGPCSFCGVLGTIMRVGLLRTALI